MAEPIVVSPNIVSDPTGCLPGNRQEMIDFIAQNLSVQFQSDAFNTFNYGTATPSAENRGRPWFRIESGTNFPLGWYSFYNGSWRRITGLPRYAILEYKGPSSVFDGTGRGLAGGQMEGFFLCNGNHGTLDLKDKFIVGSTDYSAGRWKSDVNPNNDQQGGGGSAQQTLNINNLPPITIPLPVGGGVGGNNRFVFGSNGYSENQYDVVVVGAGDARPQPFNILPPWLALAYVQYDPLA